MFISFENLILCFQLTCFRVGSFVFGLKRDLRKTLRGRLVVMMEQDSWRIEFEFRENRGR